MVADPSAVGLNPKPGLSPSLALAKWRTSISAGFQVIPNVLVRAQSKLGLDPVDLAILLNITMHWWREDELPYPQPKVIANRVGVSTRTVERRLEDLEKRGFLARLAPEKSADRLARRRIDLTGLVEKLEKAAAQNLEMRSQSGEVADPFAADDNESGTI